MSKRGGRKWPVRRCPFKSLPRRSAMSGSPAPPGAPSPPPARPRGLEEPPRGRSRRPAGEPGRWGRHGVGAGPGRYVRAGVGAGGEGARRSQVSSGVSPRARGCLPTQLRVCAGKRRAPGALASPAGAIPARKAGSAALRREGSLIACFPWERWSV